MREVDAVPPEEMGLPVVDGWSIKDLLAHITYWEETSIPDLQRVLRGDMPALANFQPDKTDAWNELAMGMRREFPLSQALRELKDVRETFREHLDRLPDEAFRSGWVPVYCAVSASHDRKHAADIREWRRKEYA